MKNSEGQQIEKNQAFFNEVGEYETANQLPKMTIRLTPANELSLPNNIGSKIAFDIQKIYVKHFGPTHI